MNVSTEMLQNDCRHIKHNVSEAVWTSHLCCIADTAACRQVWGTDPDSWDETSHNTGLHRALSPRQPVHMSGDIKNIVEKNTSGSELELNMTDNCRGEVDPDISGETCKVIGHTHVKAACCVLNEQTHLADKLFLPFTLLCPVQAVTWRIRTSFTPRSLQQRKCED